MLHSGSALLALNGRVPRRATYLLLKKSDWKRRQAGTNGL